jgi:hypothetical protein
MIIIKISKVTNNSTWPKSKAFNFNANKLKTAVMPRYQIQLRSKTSHQLKFDTNYDIKKDIALAQHI